MKVFRKINMHLIIVLFATTMILLQGCGTETKNGQAPSGSTITINPTSVDLVNIMFYGDVIQNYVAQLKYKDGTPIPDTDIVISGSFAQPVTSSTGPFMIPRYQFWRGANANANPNNVPADSGFTAVTDSSGNYQFSIQIYSSITLTSFQSSNAFTDVITITSGDATGSTNLNVTTK